MLGGLITIAGGTLAASGFIIGKKPNAKELIDKLVPYTGWIGILMFVWGVWETIGAVTGMGMLSSFPLRWVFWLCVAVADLGVGFLLFRLFDIWKPWPCRRLESLPGGSGIMADDLMAGIYANIAQWALRWGFPEFWGLA